MQVEAGVETHPATMLDQFLRGPESSQILVALTHSIIGATAIFAVGHQNGDLGAELGQLKRACMMSAMQSSFFASSAPYTQSLL